MNTNAKQINSNKRTIYGELSYKVMGALFKVHNKLGPSYQEKYYQRAIETEFKNQ
ncbi:MAG: GxxExxY protein, partial [Microgenomates group bacterium]